MQATGFLPSRDGFSFRNDFDFPGSRLGRGAPLAPGFGLAGGMCLAALDRWYAGRPLPVLPAVPAPGDILHEELLRRQVELLGHGAWDRITEWQNRPGIGGLFRRRGVGELTRSEWSRVRRSLESGMPALLCVLRTRGPFANPSENPVVLAYRYEYARETKRGTIWVYDPNRPGNDDVRLTIAPGGRGRPPEVTFVAERVRGFLKLDYDRPVSAALRPMELSASEAGGFVGRASALPGRGAHLALRGKTGGLVVVRGGKTADAEPRVQRNGSETVLASDLAVVPGPLPTILARDAAGNVLGLRIGVRGWRPRLLPSPKAPLQMETGPVVLVNRGRAHVFGVQSGKLAHLQRSRAGKWTAGLVAAASNAGGSDPLEGIPAAVVGVDRLVRVFTRTVKGRIAMSTLSKEGQWATVLLPAADAAIAGEPVAVVAPGDSQISLLAVTEEGELVHLRGGSDQWRIRNLTRETAHDGGAKPMRVEIAVTDGPGNTLHVFGVSPARGLVHYWCPPTLAWRSQDLTHGRAEIGDTARVRGRPSAVRTSDDQLVVAAAADKGIVVYRWSAASDWTGDVLPLAPSLADRATIDGPVLWRDARGMAHLAAILDDGRAILGVPGRPESAHRAIAMMPAPAIQPPRREAPLPGSTPVVEVVIADEPVKGEAIPVAAEPDFERDAMLEMPELSSSAFGIGDGSETEPAAMDLPETLLDIAPAETAKARVETPAVSMDFAASALDMPAAGASAATAGEMSLDGLGSMELPENDVNVQSLEIAPMIGSNDELIDLGDMAAIEKAPAEVEPEDASLDIGMKMDPAESRAEKPRDTQALADSSDREGWGDYAGPKVDGGAVDLGALAFEPAAPLLADPDSTPRHNVDIPTDLTLPGTTPRRAAAVEETERQREKTERDAAEKAEKAERRRLEAERVAAENAERERIETERVAADNAERERIEAERVAADNAERERIEAERVAAENAERERIEAERIAAENAERERVEGERIAAENAERERVEAERIAAENAERERVEAERIAAEKAERERVEAERIAAENAERERVEAERKRVAENAERERVEAERIAAENAERERIESERVATEKVAAEEAERKRVAEEKEALRVAAEQEAKRKEEERAQKKAEADRAKEQARAKDKPHAKTGKRPHAAAPAVETKKVEPKRPEAPRSGRVIPAALEGLPLLDDTIGGREPKASTEPAKPAETKAKDTGRPKPKLRSIDDLIKLSDEHGPTFEKK